jgi:hypothetical protein
LNEYEKFRLNEHTLEIDETIKSAPSELRGIYQKLIEQLKNAGIETTLSRCNFLTFWLGVELQTLYSDVLSSELEKSRYLQFVCRTLENIVRFSFEDVGEIAWALGSVMKETAEESLRIKKHLNKSI